MRLILGILLGFAILIGGAYFHDQSLPEGGTRLVNWNVAGDLASRGVARAREEFDKLLGN